MLCKLAPKVAVADPVAPAANVQVVLAVVQAPLQPVNVNPVLGAAVKVTGTLF
jgi:hypothetical protein